MVSLSHKCFSYDSSATVLEVGKISIQTIYQCHIQPDKCTEHIPKQSTSTIFDLINALCTYPDNISVPYSI